jgi:transposase, IS30 family
MVRGVRGVEPQVEKREQFAGLIAQGVSNRRACQVVGVARKTGTRWRLGRTITARDGRKRHYPPVVNGPSREISPRYLSEDERVRIADLDRAGWTVRAIGGELGRNPSTISRELRRNRDPVSGRYRPFAAQRLAADRRARPGRGKLINDARLRQFVAERLKQRWSPQQICHALREEFPDHPERHLVPETIYQAVYRPKLGGLHREAPKSLRTGRRRRKPRRRPDVRRPTKLVDMTMIDQRPAAAADRSVGGHWEGDLITGAGNRSAIGTLVERCSRFTILLHLPGRHTAEAVRDAIVAAFAQLPADRRRTLTWDQGSELALHAEITTALGMPVFFCDPHSPWQRPSNENTNGLLRQYFPKGSDLRVHDAEELTIVAAELNARPRKCLGWSTPAQLLAQHREPVTSPANRPSSSRSRGKRA